MKKNIKPFLTLAILLTMNLITINLQSQTPPPPNGGNTPGEGGNIPVGGGAPVGSGLLLLIGLGAAYGGKKVYDYRKKSLTD